MYYCKFNLIEGGILIVVGTTGNDGEVRVFKKSESWRNNHLLLFIYFNVNIASVTC